MLSINLDEDKSNFYKNIERQRETMANTIIDYLKKTYPSIEQKEYKFIDLYTSCEYSKLFEYCINEENSVFISVDRVHTFEIFLSFKKITFLNKDFQKTILPMVYNITRISIMELEKDKDFFCENINEIIASKIRISQNTSLSQKEELLEILQLRADMLTAENKFKQKHKELEEKMLNHTKSLGFDKGVKVVHKGGKGYYINNMKLTYSYHNYFIPNVTFEVGRLRPNGDINANIISSDNFSYYNEDRTGPRLFVGHPQFQDVEILKGKYKY